MMCAQQRALTRLHRRLVGLLGMVITEDVEHAVHDEQSQLVVQRSAVQRRVRARVVRRIAGGHRGTDEHVTEQQRHTGGKRLVVEGIDITRALDRLRAQDRAALLLHFYYELTYAEVGRCLGISMTAARSRIHRAARRVRPDLEISELG